MSTTQRKLSSPVPLTLYNSHYGDESEAREILFDISNRRSGGLSYSYGVFREETDKSCEFTFLTPYARETLRQHGFLPWREHLPRNHLRSV